MRAAFVFTEAALRARQARLACALVA